MNKLKVKTTIYCNTCGCPLKRTKTINVKAKTPGEAKKEAEDKIKIWLQSLKGQNCRVCASILASRQERK